MAPQVFTAREVALSTASAAVAPRVLLPLLGKITQKAQTNPAGGLVGVLGVFVCLGLLVGCIIYE